MTDDQARRLRLGRRPPRHTGKTRAAAAIASVHLAALGPAPAATRDYMTAVREPWGTMLNDQLGCCVCADTGHTLMLRTANAGSIVVPTDDEIRALYEAVGGYVPGRPDTDLGCDETSMDEYLVRTGFLGHRADATAPLDPSRLDHLIWGVELFGSVRTGLNLPRWAISAFEAGQTWGATPPGADTAIDGGHDVPLIDYRGGAFTGVTWGEEIRIEPPFLASYCEEAHAELFFDWIQTAGTAPSGFSLGALASDMEALRD